MCSNVLNFFPGKLLAYKGAGFWRCVLTQAKEGVIGSMLRSTFEFLLKLTSSGVAMAKVSHQTLSHEHRYKLATILLRLSTSCKPKTFNTTKSMHIALQISTNTHLDKYIQTYQIPISCHYIVCENVFSLIFFVNIF